MSDIRTHDEYIANAPEQFRPLLENLRGQLAKALPGAQEIVAYNMPGFNIGTATIAGYAAFSKQCGLYVSNGAITQCAADILAEGLKHTKTGVAFSVKKPLSDALIAQLALASRGDLGL